MTEFFKNYNGDLEHKLELKNKINLAFTELKEWQKYRLLEMSMLYLDELKKIGYLENLNEEIQRFNAIKRKISELKSDKSF